MFTMIGVMFSIFVGYLMAQGAVWVIRKTAVIIRKVMKATKLIHS